MLKKLFLLAVVMFGVMYSNAFGKGLNAHPVQVSPTLQAVQDVNQFDISEDIAAIRQAKAARDNAIRNCNGEAQTIDAIMQQFENVKKQHLENIKNRRRAQYMQGFFVTRYTDAWILEDEDPYNGDFRLDCPNPAEWVLIPGSCYYVTHEESYLNKNFGSFVLNNPREENNGYTVDFRLTGSNRFPVYKMKLVVFRFTLVARYRYNDAIIARMLDNDMTCFRNRIEAAL